MGDMPGVFNRDVVVSALIAVAQAKPGPVLWNNGLDC